MSGMRWGKAWSKAMFSMIDDNGCNDDDNNHVDEDQDIRYDDDSDDDDDEKVAEADEL